MFTGIIESTGILLSSKKENENSRLTVSAPFSSELKPGQSLSHNGVCLTVEECNSEKYSVVAVKETLERSNLGSLKTGAKINLERSLRVGDRLDGHFVQGHVDCTAVCVSVKAQNGSTFFEFETDNSLRGSVVEKGSVSVNGVSLTVAGRNEKSFSVAIIPYTFSNTNFHLLNNGDRVNVEFDILGKYLKNNE